MLTVGEIRKAIEGLPNNTPILVHDMDGLELKASIESYEGCSGQPAVLIHLEDAVQVDNDSEEEIGSLESENRDSCTHREGDGVCANCVEIAEDDAERLCPRCKTGKLIDMPCGMLGYLCTGCGERIDGGGQGSMRKVDQ